MVSTRGHMGTRRLGPRLSAPPPFPPRHVTARARDVHMPRAAGCLASTAGPKHPTTFRPVQRSA